MHSEQAIIERAARFYRRQCEREGGIPAEPSAASAVDWKGSTVELCNVRGTLARLAFRFDAAGRVRFRAA